MGRRNTYSVSCGRSRRMMANISLVKLPISLLRYTSAPHADEARSVVGLWATGAGRGAQSEG